MILIRISIGRENSGNLSSRKTVAISGLIAAVGMVLIGFGFMQYTGQTDSLENAVSVNGTVVETKITEDTSRRGGTEYETSIRFNYSYNGSNHSSKNIYPLDSNQGFESRSKAEKYLMNYTENSRVDAFVNPEKPGKGFLNAERSSDPITLVLAGFLLLTIGSYNAVKNIL